MSATRARVLPPPGRLPEGAYLAGGVVAGLAVAALLALAAYAVHPLALPAACLGLAFVALALARPPWAVALALASLPLETLAVSVGGLSPTEAMLALVGAAWPVRALLRPAETSLPGLRDLPLLLALGVVAAGLAIATDPAPVQRVVVLWSLFVAVFFTVRAFTPEQVRVVVAGFVVGAGVVGAIGAVGYLASGQTGTLAGGAVTRVRAVGAFADANYFAAVLVMGLLPGLALAIGQARRFGWLLLPAAGALAGILFSLSRGGMLGLATGLLVLLAWPRAQRTLVIVGGAALVLLVAGAAPAGTAVLDPVAQRLSTLDGGSASVVNRRPEIWRQAREVAADHPVLGVGVNQFTYESATRGLFERGNPLENAHSLPLGLAAETGLLGLAAFLTFFGQVLARGFRSLRRREAFGLKLGLLAAVLGFLVQGLTIASFRPPLLVGAFLVLAGLVTALHDHDRAERASAV